MIYSHPRFFGRNLNYGHDRHTLGLNLITLAIIMGTVGVGCVAIATAKAPWTLSSLALHQLIYLVIGIVVIFWISKIDYRQICRYSWWIFGISLLLLVMTLLFGKVVNGARRWIDIGPVNIQASEFAKLSLAFLLADITMRMRHQIGRLWSSIAGLLLILPTDGADHASAGPRHRDGVRGDLVRDAVCGGNAVPDFAGLRHDFRDDGLGCGAVSETVPAGTSHQFSAS